MLVEVIMNGNSPEGKDDSPPDRQPGFIVYGVDSRHWRAARRPHDAQAKLPQGLLGDGDSGQVPLFASQADSRNHLVGRGVGDVLEKG